MKPGFTLDYGVRLTHTRRVLRHAASRRPASTSRAGSRARRRASTARPARPACPGNQTCAANNQRAYDPANPSVLLSSAFIGNLVPGTGLADQRHDRRRLPGHAAGRVLRLHRRSWRRRASGFAWDINGDGKQALRASTGIFYAIPTRGAWEGLRRHGAGGVQPPGPVGDVRRHRELRDLGQDVRRDADQRRSTPAARRARSRSPTT